ncbi:hypothetical protein K501DRAFT_281775 [Backusella circina FSU 941]|nr:hypothetical protein K501DRAFT_281775 [Backusella circina FSU 941]
MITNPYSGRQIPGTGVLDLSVEKKRPIKEDQQQQQQQQLLLPPQQQQQQQQQQTQPPQSQSQQRQQSPTTSASTPMIATGKPAGKSIQWTTELTNTFLRFMPEANVSLKRDKDKHNKGKIWIELFDKFKETIIAEKSADERFLDMVASEHLQNKWKDLKKRYNLISNSGKSSVDWPFYEQLQNILKDNNDDTSNSNGNNNNNNNNNNSNNNDSDNDNDKNDKNENEKAKPEAAATKQTIEPEDPGITPLKRVASDFMDELKATLEEDRKLRRLDLENEGRRRQKETCLLMGSILDEMQRSSDNSFRLMRSYIQASLGEGPAYCNGNSHHHPQHPQQQSSPPPQQRQQQQQQKQEPQLYHQYQLPPHRHFH